MMAAKTDEMKKVRTSLAIALLCASWQISANSLDLNLYCKGTFRVNDQQDRASERSFVLKGKHIYFLGNEAPCDISPDQIRCYKLNESKSRWVVHIDRVSGKVDYSFTNTPMGIVEEFRGKCEVVRRAI
jgi:hypothetical protein